MSFDVQSIQAKSGIPLYLQSNGTFTTSITTTARLTLWSLGSAVPNTFFAVDASPTLPIILDFEVWCVLSDDLADRSLELRGVLNGVDAISSRVFFSKADVGKPVDVLHFTFCDQFHGPVAYHGDFQWKLWVDGNTVITAPTATNLEFYSVLRQPSEMWTMGLSVGLLRNYAVPLNPSMRNWSLVEFYRYTLEKVYGSSLYYDNVLGGFSYLTFGNWNAVNNKWDWVFRVNQYLSDVDGRVIGRMNCFDLAGIVQVILTMYRTPGVSIRMKRFGYILPTMLKGWSHFSCNNPFFGNTLFFNSNALAPNNKSELSDGENPRSRFDVHCFIRAPNPPGDDVILDCTGTPIVGLNGLAGYLSDVIHEHIDYYELLGVPMGTVNDVDLNHHGIVGINSTSSLSSACRTLAEGVGPKPSNDRPDPVDTAMKLAKVDGADPAGFSMIDPTDLSSLLAKKYGLKVTSEEVIAGNKGAEAFLLCGNRPDGVEVTLFAAESHEIAVQRMRNVLTLISAPLDIVFKSKLHLGQYTLQAAGGHGSILFVRGNVFTKLVGLASSEELGKVAIGVDSFLKARESPKRGPAPVIEPPEIPDGQVKLGDKVLVDIKVKEAGWIRVSTNSMVFQLINVKKKNGAFNLEFNAGGIGKTELQFVFAHEKSLQTATATMWVKVTETGAICKQYSEALAATEGAATLPRALPSPTAEPTCLARQLTADQLSYGQLHATLESSKEAVEIRRNLPHSQNTTSGLAYSLYGLSNCPTEAGRKEDSLAAAEEAMTLSPYTMHRRAFNRSWALRIVKAIILVTLYVALTFVWELYSKS